MTPDYLAWARSVPPAWRTLVAMLCDKPRTGDPGVRDVDAPCAEFYPVDEPDGVGDCQTDGHYLCEECSHISLRALRGLREQCEDCGEPLVDYSWGRECPEGCGDG